ncbi:hypothetical protein EGW08_012023 [Elysia chlorotica]|uniref:Transcriptional regulator ATRX n=1 Tax=Elysia chlorotica TaxID=188477 RepID=A0A3S1BCB4_ELYCH|nr:hypothetical protein EGW08_012023 [Elysia chlorotica]
MAAKLALLNEDTSQSEPEASDGGENVATRSGVKNTPAKKDTIEEQQTDTCGPEDTADENTAAKKDLLQEEAASCGSDNGEDENMVAKLDLLNELAEKMIDDDSGGACEKEESRVSRKGSPSKKETPKKVEERSKRSNANMKEDNKSENSEMDIDNDRSGDKKEESRMSRRDASKKGKHNSEQCDKDSEDDKSKDSEMDIDDGDDSGDEIISKGARRTKRGDKKVAENDKSKDSHKKNETEGKPGSKQLNIELPSRDNIVAEFSPLNSSDEEGKESEITGSKAKRNSSHTSDDDDDSRQAEKVKEKKSPTKRTREEKKGNKSKGGKIPESENDNVDKSSLGSLSSDDSDSDGNVKEKNVSKSETKKNKVTRKKTPVKSSTRKTEKTPAPQPVVSDVSSSDLLLSSDDEREVLAVTTRKKRRGKCKDTPADANIEKENPSVKVRHSEDKKEQEKAKKSSVKPDSKEEKTDKPSKAKQPPSKATAKVDSNGKQDEPKSKLNGETKDTKTNSEDGEEDEMDKEIEKLSKLPTLRKRKAKEMKEDDGSVDDPEKSDGEEQTKAPKKYKPGPKSSKAAKKNDYDNLSSDDEKPASDIDEEEDEEENDDLVPPVTFFLEPENKDDNEENRQNDEASMADEDSEKEEEKNENKDDDNSSSDEDIDVKKNTKSNRGKGGKKTKLDEAKKEEDADVDEEKEDDADEENENDEDGGKDETKKKKQIHSKLLDANISDSDDSDIVRKKKKKKASDEEASKGEESSSGSSLPSDSDEEDDNSEDTSNEDGEDSKKKKKKKGKKKGGRKKKGKGKKGTDEEGEEDSDEDSGKKKGKGKKRKRIKKVADSSDEDGEKDDDDDDDDDEKNKSGKRKQIRKVMSNKKLEDSTKAAAKAEEKRRKRIAAKQREFNIETITDENNPMNCPITTKLVLEPGKEEGDPPIVQVNKKLIQKLKPHQVEAVQFMWDCMFESVKRSKKEEGAGCILAHCMGLGKTLSVISFVHTVLSHSKVLNQKTCLVVSPLNTVLNWQNEWGLWLDEEDQFDVWELASCKQNPARANLLKDWHSKGGIMIIGYEMYRNLSQGSRCKNKRQKKIFHETLVDPGPDMVVCDEGHILKNEASSISKAMNQMKTRRRVVLTGTPLQNNLNEYHCMVSFVKPNLLGTRREFNNRFISPIQNGQCTDSTQRDFKLMKARAHVLHEMLAGCVQRRDYSALTKFLPPKQEYVISVRLTDVQIDLYDKYLQMSGQGVDGVYNNKGARLFSDYQNLMKIWTHPWVLKLAEIRDELKMKYDDEDSFIDDESDGERSFSSSDSSSENEKMNLSDSGGEGTSLGPHSKKGTRRTRAKARRQAGEESDPEEVIAEWKSKTRNGDPKDDDEPVADGPKSVTKEWWAAYVTEEDQHKLELSNKLFLLFEILKMCEEIGDKVLIFSQSILSLNIIENFLETIDSKFQQECEQLKTEDTEDEKEEFGRSWTKGLDYYRMDGSTSAQNRQAWAANFNDIENHRTRLFLISTKAGGLGINLVSANRVIIFDASWNPSHDVQSIFRVYRFGQTKPCYIYRFLAQGTMEEKIYERQVTKLSLSQRVVDEHQIERHFSANDLKELYNFKPDRWSDGTEKPTLALPKDPLLAEILTNHKHCVLSFHEHDSLLENQIEQTLSEEEKKAAWEEYENEKKGIIIRGPGMERTASWPMMAAAQILSRQQITATVQALRQRLPDVSEELFHLHVQQELRRQVQLKQEEMRRMEMLRMQEIQIMNMIKYQAQQTGLSYEEVQTQMAPWIQMQMQQMHRMRAMQSHIMNAGTSGMHGSGSLPMMGGLGGAGEAGAEGISNNPEEPIDLDDN